jgi:hypothetical protein
VDGVARFWPSGWPSRALLWICALKGLSRFDDYRFINNRPDEGLPASSVTSIVET